MDNPCNTCNQHWNATELNIDCELCCDKYILYKELISVLKPVISEKEYDELGAFTQDNYWRCRICNKYVLRTHSIICPCAQEKPRYKKYAARVKLLKLLMALYGNITLHEVIDMIESK